jgi:hypothetical protein
MLFVLVPLAAFFCLAVVSLVGLAFVALGLRACLQRQPAYGLAGIVLGLTTAVLVWAMIAMVAVPIKEILPPQA